MSTRTRGGVHQTPTLERLIGWLATLGLVGLTLAVGAWLYGPMRDGLFGPVLEWLACAVSASRCPLPH
jgi:hypothetical protein